MCQLENGASGVDPFHHCVVKRSKVKGQMNIECQEPTGTYLPCPTYPLGLGRKVLAWQIGQHVTLPPRVATIRTRHP